MTITVNEIIEDLKDTDPKVLARAIEQSIVTCSECGAGLLVKPDGTLPEHKVPGNPYWECGNRDPFKEGEM